MFEKTKINEKEPGVGPFLKKQIKSLSYVLNDLSILRVLPFFSVNGCLSLHSNKTNLSGDIGV